MKCLLHKVFGLEGGCMLVCFPKTLGFRWWLKELDLVCLALVGP